MPAAFGGAGLFRRVEGVATRPVDSAVVGDGRVDLGFVDGPFGDVLEAEVDDEMAAVFTCGDSGVVPCDQLEPEGFDPHRHQVGGPDDVDNEVRWLRLLSDDDGEIR